MATRFHDLPRVARVLVIGVCLAGVAALTWSLFLPSPRDIPSAFIYLFLAFAVASKRVVIHPKVATVSLGFVVVFASLFGCGTMVAIAAAITNILACHILPGTEEGRPALWATAYNAASLGMAALAAGLAYDRLMPPAGQNAYLGVRVVAAAAAVAVYYAASIAAVGLASTITFLELPPRRWWAELLAMAPIYCAGGAAALAVDGGVRHFGHWVFVLALGVGYPIYRSQAEQAAKLAEELARSAERDASYLAIIQALSNAIEAKDHGTHVHVQRVQDLARAVARRVGLRGEELKAIEFGAVLHDIGKLAVPDRILRKPGRLTDREFRLIQAHTIAGEAILQPVTLVRHHHEKLDGTGYPDGLRGDEISRGARVMAVIDVYDALVSDRAYRKAWTGEQALEHLREQSGVAFDREVVEALAEVLAAERADQSPPEEAAPHVLISVLDPEDGEDTDGEASGARATGREGLRHALLSGLVEATAARGDLQACVAWEVNQRSGDLEAVAARGPLAHRFAQARVPAGTGPSGQAAARGCATTLGDAADDFVCFARGVPGDLAASSVAAFPLVGSDGGVLAVLSLYASARPALSPRLTAETRTAVVIVGRLMEATGGPVPAETPHPIAASVA